MFVTTWQSSRYAKWFSKHGWKENDQQCWRIILIRRNIEKAIPAILGSKAAMICVAAPWQAVFHLTVLLSTSFLFSYAQSVRFS